MESKCTATDRLRREGRWKEATQFREETRQQLRADGKPRKEAIEEAWVAMRQDVVVLILSADSAKSDWVEHELKSARTKEKEEDRDVLCPIAVDDSWKSMMSNPNWGHLSDKLILDFASWKTKAFDKQFDKLLKGMKINYQVRQ